jgi:hypothetical protein
MRTGSTKTRGRGDWVSVPAACHILGCSLRTMKKLIDNRLVTVRSLPGSQPRVHVPSLLALAEKYTTAAEGSVGL